MHPSPAAQDVLRRARLTRAADAWLIRFLADVANLDQATLERLHTTLRADRTRSRSAARQIDAESPDVIT